MLEDPASTVLGLETKVKSGLRKTCCAAGLGCEPGKAFQRGSTQNGHVSRKHEPAWRPCCLLDADSPGSPQGSRAAPTCLKWVSSSSHPLQPSCAMASAVLPRGRHIMGHSWISRISAYLRQQEEAQEHLKDTCRDPSPVPCSHSSPSCVCHALHTPDGSGKVSESQRSGSTRSGGKPGRSSAQLTALVAAALTRGSLPAHTAPHAPLWSRPKAGTSAPRCHPKGCACPSKDPAPALTCSSYPQVWQRLLSSGRAG